MRIAFVLAALLLSFQTAAAELLFESGDRQTVMIELYTSEGCNSCPPAEAYLNDYQKNPDLWKRYFPLAFHVDYWDYLGWKDRFSKREYSERQRRYARVRRANVVYTPAFFVNGCSRRPGSFSGDSQGGARAVGKLAIAIEGNAVSAAFRPERADLDPLTLHVAVLGMGLSTQIRAGENAGRLSRHEFVVLAQKQIAGGNNHWRGTLPTIDADAAPRYAFVAWLSRADDPAPLQAVGGYLPNP